MALTQQNANDIAMGQGGSYSASRDVQKHFIWDTRFFGTTISDFVYFSQPINAAWGGTGFTKGRIETNFTDSGKLPNGQTFLAKKIRVALLSFLGTAATNGAVVVQAFVNLIQSSMFQLKIPGREFDMQIPGSIFVPTISVDTITTVGTRKGDLIASGIVNFSDSPIFIDQLVGFTVEQYVANADTNVITILNADCVVLNGANCKMLVALEGTLTRAK
jgi:hypothetical protein